MTPVSIKDIAKAAGVSHSTISRALRDSPLAAAETRTRIHQAARTMGYSPSSIARNLVTRHTSTAGLVVTTVADPFWGEVIHDIEEACQEAGYRLILCQSQGTPELEIRAVRTLREKRYVYSVSTDSVYEARLAAEHLVSLGHRRLDYLGRPPTAENADRLRGFPQTLADAGLPAEPQWVTPGDGRVRGGETGLRHLPALPHRPTAMLCYNERKQKPHV